MAERVRETDGESEKGGGGRGREKDIAKEGRIEVGGEDPRLIDKEER